MVRLQKYIADAGIASRRAAEKIIAEKRVKINGVIAEGQGIKVDPEKDIIELDNKPVIIDKEFIYIMLNKPVRYVSTVKDEKNRPTVIDLLNLEQRVFPIGRLDYMSSGLLLLTNDGDLTYRLTHPKHEVGKKYRVIVEPKVIESRIDEMLNGIDLGIYKTSPCEIELLKEDYYTQTFLITLFEGKNRQIRRMFEWAESKVKSLKRISIGEIELKDLKSGEFRKLTNKEIKYLKNL